MNLCMQGAHCVSSQGKNELTEEYLFATMQSCPVSISIGAIFLTSSGATVREESSAI